MTELIPKELLDVLACPTDKADLTYNATQTTLVCIQCKTEYPIKDGIPVLLPK